jgi:hypothetical protein
MVILEKFRKKKYQILTNNDKEIVVTTFDCRLKGGMGIVLHLNRIGPHSHMNRTKEEEEGTAARRRRRRARSAVLTPKRASQASLAANETTATFDLTRKPDKSNNIYQKLIKNRHPDKIKSVFSNISNNLHS